MRELTVVAMVRPSDVHVVDVIAAKFPPSDHEQLPPHVTVLPEIFVEDHAVPAAVETIDTHTNGLTPVDVSTRGVQVWPFRKYGGHVVSLEVADNDQLSVLRRTLHEELKMPTPPKYNPHITLQLSVGPEAMGDVPSGDYNIVVQLDEILVLARGGTFYGWETLLSKALST